MMVEAFSQSDSNKSNEFTKQHFTHSARDITSPFLTVDDIKQIHKTCGQIINSFQKRHSPIKGIKIS